MGEPIAAWVGGGALGIALVGWSALPFARILGDYEVLADRVVDATNRLGSESLWWLIDEAALGRPDRGPWYTPTNPYEGLATVGLATVAAVAVGLVVVAARGPASRRGWSATWTWCIATTAVVGMAVYLDGPIRPVLYRLPGIADNPIGRMRMLVGFAVVVLGAMSIDRVVTRKGRPPDPGRRVVRVVSGAALLAGIAAFGLLTPSYSRLLADLPDTGAALADWATEAAWAVVVVAAFAVWWVMRRRGALSPARLGAVAVVVAAAVFAASGWPMRDFTPQVDSGDFYPTLAGHEELAELSEGFRFTGSSVPTVYVNSALMHDGLVDLRGHVLQDPEWKALIEGAAPGAFRRDPLKPVVFIGEGEMDLEHPVLDDLAVGVVALSSDEIPLGDLVRRAGPTGNATATAASPVTLPFWSGPMVGADVWLARRGDCRGARVSIRPVVDGRKGAPAQRPAWDVGDQLYPIPFALVGLDIDAGSAVDLEVGLVGGGADCELVTGIVDTEGGETVAANPRIRPDGATWEPVSTADGWYYRRPGARPLVSTTDRWVPQASTAEALRAATAAGREPGGPLPVASAPPPTGGGPGELLDWSIGSAGIDATVDAPVPNLVTAAWNDAPGWSVAIDGEPADLSPVDGALLGVVVPAGRHEVSFRYDPPGFRVGVVISVVATLLAGALLERDRRRRLRNRGP